MAIRQVTLKLSYGAVFSKKSGSRVIEEKIKAKKAKVGVIGLGYVGLPLAVELGKAGFEVAGLEKNKAKCQQISSGESYILDVSSTEIKSLVQANKLFATSEPSILEECDVIVICVPTPLNETRDPDMSYIKDSTDEVAGHLHGDQLIILESTTYPGTTEEVVLARLNASGLKVGDDYCLAFSPERVDPGNRDHTIRNTPKVVGGITPRCTDLAALFYEQIVEKVIKVSSPSVAEMTKLLENIFRSVNIALVNELTLLCSRMDINIWEVVEAASSKPFGFMTFNPGPGLGGHCIPVDPFYLAWKARKYDFSTRFVELAGEINTTMPYFVVEKVALALNSRRKSLKGSKILALGIAYKKDISDTRMSPALKVIELLLKDGAEVEYHDAFVPSAKISGRELKSVELNSEKVQQADCVILLTDHSELPYQMIAEKADLILDTRNAFKQVNSANLFRL
jgi:UDP-N-acetyl-D-glucosamine dehydrogenase